MSNCVTKDFVFNEICNTAIDKRLTMLQTIDLCALLIAERNTTIQIIQNERNILRDEIIELENKLII